MNKSKKLMIAAVVFIAAINALAWTSTRFCDFYIANVFPLWVNTYGRFSALFGFSLGERLIVAGVVLLVCAFFIVPVIFLIRMVVTAVTASKKGIDKKVNKKFFKGFYKFFVWVVLIVCTLLTLNCAVLYHGTTFADKYMKGSRDSFTEEELITLRNMVVEKCNEYAEFIERDSEGRPVFEDSMEDMSSKVAAAMRDIGEDYPLLSGYYPRAKAMMFSDFMCQEHMQGYYFPFSMESNINVVMNKLRQPATIAHEYAHLHGFILEDEANFIGYLACINSSEPYYKYSGYLSVINYLNNDIYKRHRSNPNRFADATEAVPLLQVSDRVKGDNYFVADKEWDRINKKAVVDTETVDKVSDSFTDASIKINGVSDGMASYSRVVTLLLQYYDGVLYGEE
ncbi:MAG: DUF3810 domain-containing protein [Lachnospiraceae bacterium]|nr:DUF3810 domain-containing protein [Lachnospiraceae bacterium]